jgi:HSP20 family protein
MNSTFSLSGDMFSQLKRVQQSLQSVFQPTAASNIRALARRSFPAINVDATADSIEVMALAPGIDPAQLQIAVDKGLLVIADEWQSERPEASANGKTAVYAHGRFRGSFRRMISLPGGIEPARIDAT